MTIASSSLPLTRMIRENSSGTILKLQTEHPQAKENSVSATENQSMYQGEIISIQHCKSFLETAYKPIIA